MITNYAIITAWGTSVSFFKKNKPKKNQERIIPDETSLRREIDQMDQDLHLDQQIEDLTSQLNISPLDELPTGDLNISDTVGAPASLGTIGSINASLGEFSTPSLETNTVQKSAAAPSTLNPQGNEGLNSKSPNTENDIETDISSFQADAAASLNPTRLNMAEMRMDVARISSDIQGGEELYRRALQRVEGLMGSVEKAEVDFSVLNRLEPENRRLKARLRTAQSELESQKSKLNLISSDLEDHQERLDEKTMQYEQTRGKLVSATKALHEYDRVLKQTKDDVERHTLSLERNKTALNIESRENKVLREKIAELSEAVEARQSEYLVASKIAESLKADCEEFRKQAESYRAESQDLRITLNTAKRQNNSMKGEMLALHDDIKTFKTQYEFNVIDREDRVTNLESQLSTLSKELDTKKDVLETRDAEFAKLRRVRAQQDIERDRLEKALDLVKAELTDTKRQKASENSEQISQLKRDIKELQSDLSRRDEIAETTQTEVNNLRRQISSTDLEREKLQTQLDVQARELDTAQQNNPISELEAQIQSLTEQLKIKDEIVQSAARDVTALRQERETQANEKKRLEELIHGQTYQLEAAQKALLESKQNETELDQRYKDVAAALSVNNTRRKAENPSAAPDIKPDIDQKTSGNQAFDDENIDIEKRILDYKFGIVDKII